MGNTFKRNIGVGDGEIEVEYEYYQGDAGDYYQPPETDSCEIVSVTYKGVDVTEIIDDRVMDELEQAAMKDINEQYISMLEAKAEEHYEQQRLERYGY